MQGTDRTTRAVSSRRYEAGKSRPVPRPSDGVTPCDRAQRLNQGVQANVDKFEDNISKFIDVIENTDLPAKGPTGDVDTNIERSRVMAQALRDAKVNE